MVCMADTTAASGNARPKLIISAGSPAAATCTFVMAHGGKPVASVKTGTRAASRRAGLSGVTPHVLPHRGDMDGAGGDSKSSRLPEFSVMRIRASRDGPVQRIRPITSAMRLRRWRADGPGNPPIWHRKSEESLPEKLSNFMVLLEGIELSTSPLPRARVFSLFNHVLNRLTYPDCTAAHLRHGPILDSPCLPCSCMRPLQPEPCSCLRRVRRWQQVSVDLHLADIGPTAERLQCQQIPVNSIVPACSSVAQIMRPQDRYETPLHMAR